MASRLSLTARYGPAAFALLLPAILVYTSLRTFQELDQLRQVYLRNRSAAIAARLETLPGLRSGQIEALIEDEPGLLDVRILDSASSDPSTEPLWRGDELFRTESITVLGRPVFRVLAPFHEAGQLRIARMDLDPASANFLLIHARHNVIMAVVSGFALVVLAAFAVWSVRRQAEHDRKRLELDHLAHLGKLSAVLAHEIRNPLGTIKGFTQLALERADAQTSSVLQPVLTEAVRLERLVNDLLLYGRPPKPVLRRCSWNELVAGLTKCSSCEVVIPLHSAHFRTDPDMLRQVLTNLIRNSCEALADAQNGLVELSPEISGSDVIIRVDDNGPGIPEDQRDKVLESFYTTKSFGTGLGLPIATSLMAAMGGRFSLGARPGGGLRAELRLPGALVLVPLEVKS